MSNNRRLVSMPTPRAALPPVFETEPGEVVYAAPRRAHWSDNLAAKIRSTPRWILLLWLAATAVIYAYVGKLILLIVGFVLFVRGWVWLSWRFPMTMIFINICIAALLGGRRRWERLQDRVQPERGHVEISWDLVRPVGVREGELFG